MAGWSVGAWGSPVRAFGGSADAFVAMVAYDAPTPPCGNAITEAGLGEQCDDGNTLDGDCCSSTCQYEMAGSPCASDGNPCTPDTCDGAGMCVHGDQDGDGVGDLCDNCLVIFNPDQANSDCSAGNSGCTDGGDACDPCPADKNNQCNAASSTGGSVDSNGGTFTSPDGSVEIDVPPGAVSGDTTITATDGGPARGATAFRLGTVLVIQARPENQIFNQPISITFNWEDRDNDGKVDTGLCEGGADDGQSCDRNGDCASNKCSVTASDINEDALVLRRNGSRFGKNGFAREYPCSAHQNGDGCESAVADCADTPGSDKASVALCCDTANNSWTFQTCSFSEFTLGAGEFEESEGSIAT